MKMDKHVLAADIGGTHITAAVIDLDSRTILNESLVRVKLDSSSSAADIIAVWSCAILSAKQDMDINRICLAMPGPFDYDKGTCLIKDQNKYDHLYGLNIKQLLTVQLGIPGLTVKLINDAAAFLQGEMFSGAGTEHREALGITIGTGLGTCVYTNGSSASADLWNMPFNFSIAEEYLSTRWFIKRYKELTGQDVSGVSGLVTLFQKESRVSQIFNEFGQNLAAFIVKFEGIHTAELVILGGNISKSFTFFEESLLESLSDLNPGILIKTAVLGEHAALLGAASYCSLKNLTEA